MKFTATIVTFNRAESLARCLAALEAQDFDLNQVQIIVADNGSQDHTSRIAAAFSDRVPNFQFLQDDRPGQMVGWHRALEIATGEITCFIDDDAYPAPSWLSALSEVYSDSSVGLATGPIVPSYDASPPDWLDHMVLGEPGEETLPFLGLLDAGSAIRDIPGNFVWGTNFSARRVLMYEVGGFHPCAMPWPLIRFYGDGEVHVGRSIEALGRRVIFHPDARVNHQIPERRLSLGGVRAKFVSAGIARSFQHLREIRRPYELPSEEEVSAISARYFHHSKNAPVELVDTVQQALGDGISMHLKAFRDDPKFRDWVMRDSYLDIDASYTHPDLKPVDVETARVDWRIGDGQTGEAGG